MIDMALLRSNHVGNDESVDAKSKGIPQKYALSYMRICFLSYLKNLFFVH